VINDFRNGLLYKNGKQIKLNSPDKGHKNEVHSFIESLQQGKPSPIAFRSICLTTLTTFRILDSLATGLPQNVEFNEQ